MEVIRKELYAEHGRSRTMGLLPYIAYNGNGTIKYVLPNEPNGNWGNFVCDLLYTSSNNSTTLFRYLEIMEKYFFIQEQLRKGTFLKRYTAKKPTIQKLDCMGDSTVTSLTTTVAWREDTVPVISRYMYTPVSRSVMTINSEGTYITDNLALSNTQYIVLLDDAETVKKYEQWWNNSPLRALFSEGIDCPFNFCAAVDKYFTGIIEVPSFDDGRRIKGPKVPRYITYFNINDWKEWFNTHYHDNMTDVEQKEWNEHGGNPFRNFVNSIENDDIKWMLPSSVPEGLTFVSPYSEIPILLTDTYEPETLKLGYSDENTVYEENDNTVYYDMLLPQYEHMQGVVESKLNELRIPEYTYSNGELMEYILASFKDSNNNDIPQQMFKCTCHTKTVTVYTSAITKTIYEEISAYTGEKKTIPSDKITYSVSARSGDYPTVITNCYQVASIRTVTGETQMVGEYHNEEIGEYGLLNEYDFTVTSNNITYTWWECKKYNGSAEAYECADGMIVSPNASKYYRSVSVLDEIGNVETGSDGKWYYFNVRYDNGFTARFTDEIIDDYRNATAVPLMLPYKVGYVLNQRGTALVSRRYVFAADTVESIVSENGVATITYRMGANFSATTNGELIGHDINSGILYRETYPFSSATMVEANLNNYETPIHLVTVPFAIESTQIYGETSNGEMSRNYTPATIIGAELSVPQENEGLMITKENLSGVYSEPKYDVDIYINRGSAAAFEQHLKLGECNSMEDLEEYGNGAFFS